MPAPIRVWRRGRPVINSPWRASLRARYPWGWECQIPGCDYRQPYHQNFGAAPTHAGAVAAGVAHLATHATTHCAHCREPFGPCQPHRHQWIGPVSHGGPRYHIDRPACRAAAFAASHTPLRLDHLAPPPCA